MLNGSDPGGPSVGLTPVIPPSNPPVGGILGGGVGGSLGPPNVVPQNPADIAAHQAQQAAQQAALHAALAGQSQATPVSQHAGLAQLQQLGSILRQLGHPAFQGQVLPGLPPGAHQLPLHPHKQPPVNWAQVLSHATSY